MKQLNNSVKNIIGIVLPNVNDMKMIQKYGFWSWFFVFLTKVGGVMVILWFIIKVLGVHLSVGN